MLQEDGDDLAMNEDGPDDPIPSSASVSASASTSVSNLLPPAFHVLGGFPVSVAQMDQHAPEVSMYERQWVGVNGRCNKVADTCYSFWVGGTLGVSSRLTGFL